MSNTRKNKLIKRAGLVIILASLVILGLKVDGYQKQLEVINSNQLQVSELLFGGNKTPGLSCGILTEKRAEELVLTNLNRNFVQGPVDLVTENSPDNRVFWTDNCRYLDPVDSSKYIELYINSYQTQEDAELAYPKLFGIVNDIVELPAEGFGDKLAYDGGAFYLLRGSRIIQISANQGDSSDIDTFSRKVFDELMSKEPTL